MTLLTGSLRALSLIRPPYRSPSSALLMGRRTPGADASTCSPEAQRRLNDQGHLTVWGTMPLTNLRGATACGTGVC